MNHANYVFCYYDYYYDYDYYDYCYLTSELYYMLINHTIALYYYYHYHYLTNERHYSQMSHSNDPPILRVITTMSPVQVLCWEEGTEQSAGEGMRVAEGDPGPMGALFSGLKSSAVYLVTVRARNTAGLGPPSAPCNITTKKPRKTTTIP